MSQHSSVECELLQLPDYLTPGLLDFEFGNSPIHSSPFDHFCTRKIFLFFSLSLYQFHFSKKKNWRKVIFLMLPIPTKISFWTVALLNSKQFSVDISVLDTGKYRKLVLTGKICRRWRGRSGLERIYVEGLEITYLLMHFWTRSHPPRSRTKWCNGTPLAVLGPY